jgi:hypothetical protein
MADVGKQIKEGRHVGLDIYDLLIEALMANPKPSLQKNAACRGSCEVGAASVRVRESSNCDPI